ADAVCCRVARPDTADERCVTRGADLDTGERWAGVVWLPWRFPGAPAHCSQLTCPSGVRWSSGEEAAERIGDGEGSIFGEQVPSVDRFAGDVGGEFGPQRERSAIVAVPGRQRSGRAP